MKHRNPARGVQALQEEVLSQGKLEAMLGHAEAALACRKLRQELIDIVNDFYSEDSVTE